MKRGASHRLCLTALIGLTGTALAGPPATAPARTRQQVIDDIQAAKLRLSTAIGDPHDVGNPTKRAKIAVKAVPELQRLIDDVDELVAADPDGRPAAEELKDNFKTMMAALGDPAATAEFDALASDPDPVKAVRGKAAQLTARWVQSVDSPTDLNKIADELLSLDKAHPESELLTKTTVTLSQSTPDHVLTNRMVRAATLMTNPYAARLLPLIPEGAPPITTPTTNPAR